MHQLSFRVRWGDCDPAGIVYYPRFLEYMNDATHGLVAASGYSLERMKQDFDAVGFPMVALSVEYRSPMKLDDQGVIETRVLSIGRSSMKVSQRILSGSRVVAEATETRVFTGWNADGSLAAREIPDALRAALSAANL